MRFEVTYRPPVGKIARACIKASSEDEAVVEAILRWRDDGDHDYAKWIFEGNADLFTVRPLSEEPTK